MAVLLMALLGTNLPELKAQSEFLDISSIVVGTITGVKGHSMSVLRDIDHGLMVITIDTNSVYNNAQGFSEFKKGDKIQVRFKKDRGKNIAISITKMGG